MSDWISTKERLPDKEAAAFARKHGNGEFFEVNAMIDGASVPTTLYYEDGAFFDEENGPYNVVCWAPIPDAPEKKEEKAVENQKTLAEDPVNHPGHYTFGGIECIDAIKAATGDGFPAFLQGQVIKYIWRYQHKVAPVEDLKKCRWYLDRLIRETEGENEDEGPFC